MGFNSYRKFIHLKKDPFEDYKLKNTEEDQQKLKEFSNTILEISKNCFDECITLGTSIVSPQEQKCVRECTNFQYKCMLNLVKYHNKE